MANEGSETVSFAVEGMGCGGCAAGIANTLRKAPGVLEADVDYATARAIIAYDPQATDAATLGELIRDDGYTVTPLAT